MYLGAHSSVLKVNKITPHFSDFHNNQSSKQTKKKKSNQYKVMYLLLLLDRGIIKEASKYNESVLEISFECTEATYILIQISCQKRKEV